MGLMEGWNKPEEGIDLRVEPLKQKNTLIT
jgi:hypothetical protein